ncbi:MAG: PHP domain-containing protein [Acidobacteria bacterium]|nr:PHP domain-containing protein [Acidobacteriota bacterium]
MIDLHLHTTASDGALGPAALVARAASAGITTLAVTDHDTTGGLDEARAAASARGIRLVNGIEITAVEGNRDVHVLGYFFAQQNPALRSFLEAQSQDRIRRVKEMAEQLAVLGVAIDADPIVREGIATGRSVGRPHVAAALLAAGHVQTRDEAFDRFLENGRPAFIPRRGASPDEVVSIITTAGGVASLAHPGLAGMDAILPRLTDAGLHALEVRHTDHDDETEARYRRLAAELGLAVSAGSDFHDDTGRRRCGLGQVTLTAQEFAALEARRA